MTGGDPLPGLRKLCLALPEATEKLSHGSPTWFVKKVFVTYVGHHHDDPRDGMWCAAPPGAQEALVAARPQVYFRPPYVGHRGWLGVDLDALATGALEWKELAEIVTDAYREIAPKRLLAQLDAPGVCQQSHCQDGFGPDSGCADAGPGPGTLPDAPS